MHESSDTSMIVMTSQCHFSVGGNAGGPSCNINAVKQATPTAIAAPSGCKRFEASTHQLKSMIPVATATGIPMNLRISVGFIFFLLQEQRLL